MSPETNILMLDVAGTGRTVPELLTGLQARGVRMGPFGGSRIRAVLHQEVADADLAVVESAFASILGRTSLTSSAY